MTFPDQVEQDFITGTQMLGSDDLVFTRTGPGTTTAISLSQCNETTTSFEDKFVPGYMLDKLKSLFLVSALGFTPKLGDLIQRVSTGITFQVIDVTRTRRDKVWSMVSQRAYLSPDYATTCLIERSSITQNAVKQDVQTWATLYASASCYRNPQNVPAEMGTNFGVLGINNRSKLYLASTVTGVRASDRLTIGGATYTVLNTQNDSRIALLPELELQRLL